VPALGLTGGIATGKSTFARLFRQELGCEVFDSDASVHGLLAGDPETRDSIVETFGVEILGADGWPDRTKLRERVFRSSEDRKALEAILHPRVRAQWIARLAETSKTDAWQLIDIPLLYETGVQAEFDRVIVVAAPYDTQLQRLVRERNLEPALAEQMIAAQLDLGIKIEQADHVIWNDSTVSNLDGQSRLLASWLKRQF